MGFHDDMLYVHGSEANFLGDDQKFRQLEERLKAVEGVKMFGLDINNLGLVLGVRVPPKFKVPVFDKYTGVTCPKTHVKSYYRNIYMHYEDERLLMHFF